MTKTSRFPGFYKVTIEERRELVRESTGVDAEEAARALSAGGLDAETADKFVENVLGTYAVTTVLQRVVAAPARTRRIEVTFVTASKRTR